jgi:hypothetical protein
MSDSEEHCPYCGTLWRFTGYHIRMFRHRETCANRSPRLRRHWIDITRRRLIAKPNKHVQIIFNLGHPGLKDAKKRSAI